MNDLLFYRTDDNNAYIIDEMSSSTIDWAKLHDDINETKLDYSFLHDNRNQ